MGPEKSSKKSSKASGGIKRSSGREARYSPFSMGSSDWTAAFIDTNIYDCFEYFTQYIVFISKNVLVMREMLTKNLVNSVQIKYIILFLYNLRSAFNDL